MMGGTSQDVKRQKSGIFTLYTLGSLDNLQLFALLKKNHVFEASRGKSYYVM